MSIFKMNAHKKSAFVGEQVTPDKIAVRTATVAGATTGLIAATDEIVEALGVTGQTNYLVLLPNPSTLPRGKKFIIYGKSFASKLGVVNTPTACTVNGIAGASASGTIAVGAAYEVTRIADDAYIVRGMVIA